MASLKFIKKATVPSTGLIEGAVYFETSTHLIKVATSATATEVYSGVRSASYDDTSKVLNIVNEAGTSISLDLSDVASASDITTKLAAKANTSTTISAGDGLTGGGSLAANRTISHGSTGSGSAVASGLYKVALDKFGHVSSATAVAKVDITDLGIPASDTTYTFTGGTNKITVTPSGGTAVEVAVTPSIANNVVKTTAATTAGYIAVFNDTAGTIKNGYSVQTTLSSSSTAIPTAAAVESAINSKISASDAMIFKGTLGTDGDITTVPTSGYKTGWTYKVITAGTYAGFVCEVGDMLIALNDGPASGTAVVNADWTVVQTNIDGAVTGPTSAVANRVAVFSDATGKVIKDSGYTIATSVPSGAKFTDTDTKVTSVANHYTPVASGATNATETAGSAVAAGGKVIVSVQKDAAGHITGVTTGTIPAAQTLAGLGGVGSISASGTAPLSLSAEKVGTSVTISGSVSAMGAASSAAAGSSGLVPAPAAGDQAKFLRGDGTWVTPANTNTTYTFASGTAGAFTVTPSNGTAQTVSIGKPSTAVTADQVANSLVLKLNGGSIEGTSMFTYSGSAAKSVNITPASIGAATSTDITNAINAALVWEEFA